MQATHIALRSRHNAICVGMQEVLSYNVMGKLIPVMN